MQNPSSTALQTNLVPAVQEWSHTGSKAETRQCEITGSPISVSYDSAGCSRSDVKIQLGEWAWKKNLPYKKGREKSYLLHSAEFIHSALVMLHTVLSKMQVG
jgi:hypothetical protein